MEAVSLALLRLGPERRIHDAERLLHFANHIFGDSVRYEITKVEAKLDMPEVAAGAVFLLASASRKLGSRDIPCAVDGARRRLEMTANQIFGCEAFEAAVVSAAIYDALKPPPPKYCKPWPRSFTSRMPTLSFK